MCKSVALCGIVWQVLDRVVVGVYICYGFGACFGGWRSGVVVGKKSEPALVAAPLWR